MVLLIPINGAIAAKQRQFQVKQMKHKDSRVKTMNEILQGIKVNINIEKCSTIPYMRALLGKGFKGLLWLQNLEVLLSLLKNVHGFKNAQKYSILEICKLEHV